MFIGCGRCGRSHSRFKTVAGGIRWLRRFHRNELGIEVVVDDDTYREGLKA